MIPKTFELVGRKWTVSAVSPEQYLDEIEGAPIPPESEAAQHADSGACSHVFAKIWVVPKKWGSDEYTTISYFHELAHALFLAMGRVEDSNHPPEEDIELLGNLLYQYEKTKKGETKLDG